MNYWYMQLHPGSDAKWYDWRRMLGVVERFHDIGMGDESQWQEGGVGIRQRFRETMQIGDVVVLAHGKKMFALVQVAGEAVKNLRQSEEHWYGLCRHVEILSATPDLYLSMFQQRYHEPAVKGLNIRQTLCRVLKNKFVKFWYEKVSNGETYGDAERMASLPPKRVESFSRIWKRDSLVVRKALGAGKCECCGRNKTFEKEDGCQYFEVHHLVSLSQQMSFGVSLDVGANVVCICPECHRLLHYGRKDSIRKMLRKIYCDRTSALRSAKIAKSLSGFLYFAIED